MDLLQEWANIATLVSCGIALVAVVLGLIQIHKIAEAEKAASRSYVTVRLQKGTTRGQPSVFLLFSNHGRAAACNIKIRFEHQNNWHYVRNPELYPFTTEAGINWLYPGEERKYFLGQMKSGSRLLALKNSEVKGTLIYSDEIRQNREEPISITLADLVFVAK